MKSAWFGSDCESHNRLVRPLERVIECLMHEISLCYNGLALYNGYIIKEADRLEDVTVVVSNKPFPAPEATPLDDPDYTLCAQYRGIPPPGSAPSFNCVGVLIFARYVYVYLPRLHEALTLCEVEVFAGGKFRNVMLTHWGRDKMADIFQTTFWNAFSWTKKNVSLKVSLKLVPKFDLFTDAYMRHSASMS